MSYGISPKQSNDLNIRCTIPDVLFGIKNKK